MKAEEMIALLRTQDVKENVDWVRSNPEDAVYLI